MGYMRIVGLPAILGLLAISPLVFPSTDAQDTAELSGQGIVARTAATYAHCKSYQDVGVVEIVFLESGGRRTQERPFRTAFVRPDCFRFEYTETDLFGAKKRYIVCRVGTRVQTWWDLTPGIEVQESLGSALAAATGVSGESAHMIPALLLPGEVGGRRLTEMTEAKRLPDAKLGGADCFRVEGRYAGAPRTVWVDQKTFLIRRVEFEATFPDFRAQHVMTYEPLLDEEVAPGLLEFDPPATK